MKVNINEYENQRKEKMIKSEHYARSEIVVSKDDWKEPYAEVRLKNVSNKEIAILIIALQNTLNQLRKECPKANIISELLNSKVQTFSYDPDDKEVEIDDIN